MVYRNLIIHFAKLNDLPFIVDIYNQAIRNKNVTGDLTEFGIKDRLEWFKKFDSNKYPIYIAEIDNKVVGYSTLYSYRPGREAMSTVAEISYYLDYSFQGKGIGTNLLKYVIADCSRIGIRTLVAILLDINVKSIGILEKFNFIKWGHLPNIININKKKCGQLIYGLKIP